MGWASGSALAEDIWEAVAPHLRSKAVRQEVARAIIDAFEYVDCDTLDECEDLCEAAGRVYDEEAEEYLYKD